MAGQLLAVAGHTDSDFTIGVSCDRKLDRSTANLAIFDVALLVVGRIDQDVDPFTTVWALDGSLLQFTHDFEIGRRSFTE